MVFEGSRLASRRRSAGLSQDQLARALGTEQTNVSAWERNAKRPRPSSIPRLAAALGSEPLQLVARDPLRATIEDLRLAAGLLPAQVAASLDITVERYRALESGSTRRRPTDELVERLAAVLGVRPNDAQRALDRSRG